MSNFLRFIAYFIFLGFSFIFCQSSVAKQNRVAIIIDDIGYRYTDKNVLDLPSNITLSILPHTPYGKKLAVKANAANHDVLIHVPMEATNGKKLGPGGLTSDMNEVAIHQSLASSFKDIPFAIGINNHMGSKLTTLYKPMASTMTFLKARHLFFLDSKTSVYSKAEQAALDLGVPVRKRNVFLDNQLSDAYIEQQFMQLMQVAKTNSFAIAIAHPHPETIANLTRLIPTLKEHNIDLVPLSDFYPQAIEEKYTLSATE